MHGLCPLLLLWLHFSLLLRLPCTPLMLLCIDVGAAILLMIASIHRPWSAAAVAGSLLP
jgi:hypothetical protein